MKRAARYLRVSNDQQRHSLAAQAEQIAGFAVANGYEIVRTYQDEGKSGLHLRGRLALQQLLRDAMTTTRGFDAILVQDVSRWGRFQDADEAAHYEFLCREAGLEIRYCAEPFDDFAGHTGDIFKAVKRLMAADFSRSLSAKTRAAQAHWFAQGYRMGGRARYGLRRAIVDEAGELKGILAAGQERLLRGDRVILVRGPEDEVAIVRRIFRLFLDDGLTLSAIAGLLNAEGVSSNTGSPWNWLSIGSVLSHRAYAGESTYGVMRQTLDGSRLVTPEHERQWTRNFVDPLVPKSWLAAAAKKRRAPRAMMSRSELLERLRNHVSRVGQFSPEAIERDAALPSLRVLRKHFGPDPRILARLHLQRGSMPHRAPAYSDLKTTSSASGYTAFRGEKFLKAGDLQTVALSVRAIRDEPGEMPIVFDDDTGVVVDINLSGSRRDVLQRLPKAVASDVAPEPFRAKRGRPKLGVTAHEVTLLPRHWEWLAQQPGGASGVLRRLVEEAQKDERRLAARNATLGIMQALAGHQKGHEEALRALCANDQDGFQRCAGAWPDDVRAFVLRLSAPVFS